MADPTRLSYLARLKIVRERIRTYMDAEFLAMDETAKVGLGQYFDYVIAELDAELKSPVRLVTVSMAGNVHETAEYVNKTGLAKYVMTMEYSNRYTTVIYRMTQAEYEACKTRRVLR